MGRINSSMQAILHREDVNEREGRVGERVEEICLSIVLVCAFISFEE